MDARRVAEIFEFVDAILEARRLVGWPHGKQGVTMPLPKITITPRSGFRHVSGRRVESTGGGTHPAFEDKCGEFRRGDGGGFVSLQQKIDRDHTPPWYTKRVVDLTTGIVTRDVSHPLSEHTGRGSDKPKRKS